MSLVNIGGNLFTRHPNKKNHVHKHSNYLLSVIIVLGTDVHCGVTVFNGITINDIGKEHRLLIIHTEGVWLVLLIKNFIKALFGMDPEVLYLLSYTNKYFFNLYIMVQNV